MSSEKYVQSPRLSVHLDWLIRELEPKAEAVRSLLARDVEADFFCFSSGATSQPPRLPQAVRDRAAALGIAIVIDHYGEEPRTDRRNSPTL